MNFKVLSLVAATGFALPALAFQASQLPSQTEAVKKVMAQESMAANVKASGKAPTPTFSDSEIKSIAEMLSGQWKSTAPVDGDNGSKVELVMGVAPVVVQGLNNTLYCEVARADQLRVPVRQTILSLERVNGKIRMTTFEYRRPRGQFPPAYTLWAAPSAFPWEIGTDDLIATLALELVHSGSGGGIEGKTPHPYPTGIGGAVEMTSQIMVSKDSFEVADRGFGADGKQLWGPAPGSFTKFTHADLGLKVVEQDGGLVSITYPSKLEGKVATKDEQVTCEYVAYLTDGRACDSTFERQRPLVFPQGIQLIKGWMMQMDDTQKGLVRRLVIPPQFGYGEKGRRGKIPPNATLYYDIEIKDVSPPPPPPAPAAMPSKEPSKEPAKEPVKEPVKEQMQSPDHAGH